MQSSARNCLPARTNTCRHSRTALAATAEEAREPERDAPQQRHGMRLDVARSHALLRALQQRCAVAADRLRRGRLVELAEPVDLVLRQRELDAALDDLRDLLGGNVAGLRQRAGRNRE